MATREKIFPRKNNNAVFRKEADEGLLFNADTLEIVAINETGCFIWHLCTGENLIDDINKNICQNYDVTPDRSRKDLDGFLKGLASKKFLKI